MTQNAVTHITFVKWSVESVHLGKLLSHVCNGPVPIACATSFVDTQTDSFDSYVLRVSLSVG
jgi:hypothetical protein